MAVSSELSLAALFRPVPGRGGRVGREDLLPLANGETTTRDSEEASDRFGAGYPELRRLLAPVSYPPKLLRAGRDILMNGEGADPYLITDGWLIVYVLFPDGRRQILRIVLPGEFIGLDAVMGRRQDYAAEAITDCSLLQLSRRSLVSRLQFDSTLSLRLARILADELHATQATLTSIARRSCSERLAFLLLDLYCRYLSLSGRPRATAIPFPLTQEQLGDALGISSVHVSRTLSQLRRLGLAELRKRRLVVLDLPSLAAQAGATELESMLRAGHAA